MPEFEAQRATMDGNTAVAHVAYRVNEVCAIFPITPSSTMAELADEWSSNGVPNIWGNVPVVQEMQSEGGAAGALHGALQAGALTTTFTASQGLLLMVPNMFKIAGELTPTVFHVAARSLATQGLSIFGDHSDVMAVRSTGFAMLCSGSVQEAHDMALVAQAATLESRLPFIHFFDGFRTSHEVNTLTMLGDAQIRALIDDDLVRAHRARALNPEHPFVRGTSHNPDSFFQARETVNPFYASVPEIVSRLFDRLADLTGRRYRLFDYEGADDAERVIVVMGSSAEVARETAADLNARGEKVGVLTVRLYRPFSAEHLLAVLPESVRRVAVLDRTKEAGASGEPLYLDVVAALANAVGRGRRKTMPLVIGGRYGLSSKDFDPAQAKGGVRRNEGGRPEEQLHRRHQRRCELHQLTVDPDYRLKQAGVVTALFYGLGSDGTVGGNKNSVKIIAEDSGLYAQGYFEYDSHKSGAQTISHLRFGPIPSDRPIWSEAPISSPATSSTPAAGGRAAVRRARRHLLAQQPLRSGAGVGQTAALGAARDHRQAVALLRHRRQQGGARGRACRPHQHYPPNLLLRGFGRAAARGGHRAHQGQHPQDLWREGRQGRRTEFCRRRWCAGPAQRSGGADGGEQRFRAAADRAGDGARFRASRHGPDDGGQRRPDSGQRHAGRRHVSIGHRRLGKARPRRGSAGMEQRALHPVRPVQLRLSAFGDPGQIL